MGNKVGKIFSMVTRPIRNVNIEQRAHKVISREKPLPAPKYESTLRQIKLSEELDPEFTENQKVKDPKLDEYLKNVFVTSKDVKADGSTTDATKCFPTSRKTFEYEDYNYYYVRNVSKGKCSMEQLQSFLSKHMDDPKKYNASIIAEEYRLDKKAVENILEYYKVFRIVTVNSLEKMKKDKEPVEQLGPMSLYDMTIGMGDKKKK